MAKGIKRKIKAAREKVTKEISASAAGNSRYAGALASEGYAGGYQAALDDVLLLLNGIPPCRCRRFWED